MKFNISIINVQAVTKPTAKGSYTMLDIAFKRLDTGKIEGKKIMSFTFKDVFKALSNATNGQEFTITTEKNAETTYWDWTEAVPSNGAESSPAADSPPAPNKAGFASPKSNYETPEERAARQVLIVRQSSLSNAIETLSDGKKLPTPDDVMALATRYTNWVFQKGDDFAITNGTGFDDMADDIPM